MISHKIKVYPSKIHLPKKNQLAWKIAEIASDNAKLDKNRGIINDAKNLSERIFIFSLLYKVISVFIVPIISCFCVWVERGGGNN